MIENITDWTEATVLGAYRKAQEWMETAGSQLSVGVTEEYDLHIIKFNIKFHFLTIRCLLSTGSSKSLHCCMLAS